MRWFAFRPHRDRASRTLRGARAGRALMPRARAIELDARRWLGPESAPDLQSRAQREAPDAEPLCGGPTPSAPQSRTAKAEAGARDRNLASGDARRGTLRAPSPRYRNCLR